MNLNQEYLLPVPESAGRPRASRRFDRCRTALVLASAAMALGLCGCEKAAPPAAPPPMVEVMTVTTTNAPWVGETIGQLDSPQTVEIRARVEAFVDKMLFKEGTNVKEGEPLFELDKRPYEEKLAAANGALAEAKAALNKYEKDVARLTPLATNRAIPQQDLDNAIASVEIGNASVLSAKAQVESAQLDVGYCDVRAPISGLIGAKQVSIGDLVGKGQPTLLATMSTLDPIWFYCNVTEVGILKAEAEGRRTGKRFNPSVTLVLGDGSVHPQEGKFVFFDRAVDVKTGTLRARVEFPNPDQYLRPGMFGRIRVDLGTRPGSILLPARAVVELQGKNFVWVIGSDDKASQRPVTVSDQIGESLLIKEGLKAGERIVVEGLQKVREGLLVQPKTAAEIAAVVAKAAQPPEGTPAKAGEAKHGKE